MFEELLFKEELMYRVASHIGPNLKEDIAEQIKELMGSSSAITKLRS